MIFARKDRVGYTFSSGRIGRVPANLAKLHQVNASYKYRAKCLEQMAESLRVRPSPWVFGRVPGCSVESLDSMPTHSRQVILANVEQSTCLTLGILKSLYPLADFNATGDGSDLVSTLCSY
jgi:hypothetical protein